MLIVIWNRNKNGSAFGLRTPPFSISKFILKIKVRGNEYYGLQINPFEDNDPFKTTFRLFWVFSNFILNKISIHNQHLLSFLFSGRKIGVV